MMSCWSVTVYMLKHAKVQLVPDVIAIRTSVPRSQTSKCEKNATAIEKESQNVEEYRGFL